MACPRTQRTTRLPSLSGRCDAQPEREGSPRPRGRQGRKGANQPASGSQGPVPASPGFGQGWGAKAGHEPLPRSPGSRSQSQTPCGEPQSPPAPPAPPSPALTLTAPPRRVRTRGAPALSAGGADSGALRGRQAPCIQLKELMCWGACLRHRERRR